MLLNKIKSIIVLLLHGGLLFSPNLFGAQSAKQKNIFKIGYVGGLTGYEVGQSSKYALEALELIADQVNAGGGIRGRRVEVVPFDNKGLVENNVGIVAKAKELGVDVLTGVHYSNDALLLAKEAEQLQVPLVVTTASHPEVVNGRKFVSRVCFQDYDQVEALVGYTAKTNPTSIVIINDIQNSFSIFVSGQYEKRVHETLKKASVKVIPVLRANQDYGDVINQILSSGDPDVILFTTQSKLSSDLIRGLKEKKSKAFMLGTDAWVSVDFIKMIESMELRKGLAFPGHWPPTEKNQHWNQLRDRIRKNFHVELSALLSDPILTFDAGHLIIEAFRKWDQKSPTQLAKLLREVRFDGILGARTLQTNGESNMKVYMFELRDGKVRSVRT
jgi:branched-chain amino acid transport system substrate-binding protein